MPNVCRLLKTLESFAQYDVRVVSVSPSYVKIDQRVTLDPEDTIKKLVVSKFPWMQLDDEDCAVGFGICSNNEPERMTWNRARVVMNTSIGDLWPHVSLDEHQEYLIVCCLFSRDEFNRQKDRLENVIDEMGKWIPPKQNRKWTLSEVVKEVQKHRSDFIHHR
jgi:hypothetical protein